MLRIYTNKQEVIITRSMVYIDDKTYRVIDETDIEFPNVIDLADDLILKVEVL